MGSEECTRYPPTHWPQGITNLLKTELRALSEVHKNLKMPVTGTQLYIKSKDHDTP